MSTTIHLKLKYLSNKDKVETVEANLEACYSCFFGSLKIKKGKEKKELEGYKKIEGPLKTWMLTKTATRKLWKNNL